MHDYNTVEAQIHYPWYKAEHNMLKTSPIIPSNTSQKFTHYSYFIPISLFSIPFLLWYCVLTSRETWTWCIFCCIAIVYMSVMYYTSKIVNESHPCLSLNWHISHVTVYHWFSYVSNSKQLFLHHTCECPIIPRIMFAITVTYNSGNYVGTLGLRPTQAYQCSKHYRR